MAKLHTEEGHGTAKPRLADLAKLSLGALGVVYGDIGTSPLYSVKECFGKVHGVPLSQANVLGVLSLVFWSLTLVVVVKYLSFIMRADNKGEGGILALLALVSPDAGHRVRFIVMLGLFGAALLYGDGMITPAISVLSAVEGLEVATTSLKPIVLPMTVAILFGLFVIQKRGTERVGNVFGPTMVIWFAAIAMAGLPWIVRRPDVLIAVNPWYAVQFMVEHKLHGFLVLGSVVLCITGGEALYADMGHFGPRPIRTAWYVVVFPCLLLNYFGQGGVLLERGREAAENPFYSLVSGWVLYPFVAIATCATVVASQALISGAFSLTRQAVQLGFCPRVTLVHTSGKAEGQIYIPEVNSALMVACIGLVLAFRDSSRLAAAYGIAVTGTMGITTLLFWGVARHKWNWSVWRAGSLTGLFLVFDLAFFGANAIKLLDGGWVPIVIAAVIFTIMMTWKQGRTLLRDAITKDTLDLSLFMEDLRLTKPMRVRGTAVFMTTNLSGAPPVLLHHFKHNKVLHEQVVLLSVLTKDIPEVGEEDRIDLLENLGEGFHRLQATYGFMQTPNVMQVLELARTQGLETKKNDTSFFLGRETLLVDDTKKTMARWRKGLFMFLSRNARPANVFFGIPSNRVVELGTRIEL
ncbi:MAG: potassium transporter Kup [Myxococcales bacterium]